MVYCCIWFNYAVLEIRTQCFPNILIDQSAQDLAAFIVIVAARNYWYCCSFFSKFVMQLAKKAQLVLFFFLGGKLLELAKMQLQKIVLHVLSQWFVGEWDLLAVLLFGARDSKRALPECASWWRYMPRLDPNLQKICNNFEKLQAPPNIAEFVWFCVHFCNREILEGLTDV